MMWTADYIGKPFADGGRGPGSYDCWGLIFSVYRDRLGIDLPAYGEISAADILRIRREISTRVGDDIWDRVQHPQEFDVAVMRLPTGKAHGHVGVMVNSRCVMHVERASHVAIERIDGVTIRNRILGFYRHV